MKRLIYLLAAGAIVGMGCTAQKPITAPAQATAPIPARSIAASPATAPSPTPGKTYVIRNGDYLWKIALAAYGDGTRWDRILAANPGLVPERMRPGQVIVIPSL